MRTTINIDDQVFFDTKIRAQDTKTTFSAVIEDALRSSLHKKVNKTGESISLRTVKGTGLRHGIDLDDGVSLLGIMDG